MAHNLATINGRTAMAYQGATPWHKLGTRVTDDAARRSVEAVLAAASLDYTVEKQPLYLGDGSKVNGREGVLRVEADGSRVQLGTVGDGYQLVQNIEAASIMRPLTDLGCTIESAGALGNGERAWMLAKMADTVTPVPGDDVRGYFLLHWSHDGQTGVNGLGTGIRVVCQNTLTMATGRGSKQWVAVRHTTNAAGRIDEAAALMRKLTEAMQQTGETFAQLGRKAMTAQQLAAYIETVIPQDGANLSPVLKARRDTLARLAFFGKGAEMANQLVPQGSASLWAAYNAVTEYFDHVRPAEAQSPAGVAKANESALFGGNAQIKAQALTVARQLVAV